LPALTIQNRVRAMIPWPGSFTFCPTAQGTLRLIVQRVDVVEGPQTPRAAGTIVHLADDALWVQAGDGRAVALRQVQPAGKRSMEIGEFLRGHRLQAGDRLTPEAPGGR
jgi:methionyl-tRNA formyltransferase